jgi:hypothetical protein
VLLDVVKRAG